jgi:putative transposase
MSTKVRNLYQPSLSIVEDSTDQIRQMIHQQVRGAALAMIQDLLLDEVASLCGPTFSRKGKEGLHRGGSDPGSVILEGKRIAIKKPRARKAGKDIELQSYAALQGYDMLQDRVVNHMMSGVSTRSYDGLLDEVAGGMGLQKSAVSKAFVKGSKEALEFLNGRDLSSHKWMAIMIDGIEFAGSCVIAAMGITIEGKKLILGLKLGDTENWEVCKDLLQEILLRGLQFDSPILFVLDGSKALKKAVGKVFGQKHPVQRCIRHKERNCLKYLPEQYHPEFRRRWKLLHGMSRYDDAKLETRLSFRLGAHYIDWRVLLELVSTDKPTELATNPAPAKDISND